MYVELGFFAALQLGHTLHRNYQFEVSKLFFLTRTLAGMLK